MSALRELVARWRADAALIRRLLKSDALKPEALDLAELGDGYASELEAALAEEGWVTLDKAPLGVPLELWGRHPYGIGPGQEYPGEGFSRYLPHGLDDKGRDAMAANFWTHARRVQPSPETKK